METITTIAAVRERVHAWHREGLRVAFVPTMGNLHPGHVSLIEGARRHGDRFVASIFVNPMQFGPNEDLSRYPRTLDADMELCGRAGADALFVPDASTIYPPGFRTFVEVPGMQDVLCGASRPGHFRGVCTVVLKLFNIVQPDVAYFGQKDAQQSLLLKRMARDLDLPIEMRIVPTVREPDGLAMSSRNRYLTPAQRAHAAALWRALQNARHQIETGERDHRTVERAISLELSAVPEARVDYARVVAVDTLETPARLQGDLLIAVAVYIGTTRLIDNLQISVI
jgi:pantoate--beta-alanine ligase